MLNKIWTFVKNQSVIWVTTTLLAILTMFSETLVDKIKSGLNKADKRFASLEAMAKEFSGLQYNAKSLITAYGESINSGRGRLINPKFMYSVVNDFNSSIISLMSDEMNYRYEVSIYSRKKWLFFNTDILNKMDTLYLNIKNLDSCVHLFNPVSIHFTQLISSDTNYILSLEDSTTIRKCLDPCRSQLIKSSQSMEDVIDSYK